MTTELPTPRTGISLVPRRDSEAPPLGKKDYTSDQEVRWCPGCGDYAVLAAVQSFLPTLGLKRENIVCVSGIGCSSRFPYYLNTYGIHSIHGRAPSIATGLAVSRPDLSVWVVTGDGDALSIGGNHLIHALRRNVNITIMLFNNRIYGLTKGQYSPTSPAGLVTKSTPSGSVDHPFNPLSLALGAEASFVARAMDTDRAHLTEVLRQAAEHRGASLVEIYQNCPIFNDGAFELFKDRDSAEKRMLHVKPGVLRASDGNVVIRNADGSLGFAPEETAAAHQVVQYDPACPDPSTAFALSRLDGIDSPYVPFGVLRSVQRPTYDDTVREQITTPEDPKRALESLLKGKDSWTIL